MKNKVKITALTLALIVSMASIVGCSNNSSTSAEASVSSNSSIESSIESSIGESSVSESSAEISSETTSATESSVSSNSSAVDPVVEERSYSDEEKYKPQPTKFSDYSYYPAVNGYEYSGKEDARSVKLQNDCHLQSERRSRKDHHFGQSRNRSCNAGKESITC